MALIGQGIQELFLLEEALREIDIPIVIEISIGQAEAQVIMADKNRGYRITP